MGKHWINRQKEKLFKLVYLFKKRLKHTTLQTLMLWRKFVSLTKILLSMSQKLIQSKRLTHSLTRRQLMWQDNVGQMPSIQEGSAQKLQAFLVVYNEDLEFKVLNLLTKVGCKIPSRDNEACHCLTNSNDRVIVKFSPRKDCDQVMSLKRDLSNWKMLG